MLIALLLIVVVLVTGYAIHWQLDMEWLRPRGRLPVGAGMAGTALIAAIAFAYGVIVVTLSIRDNRRR
jgi:hypothetical protein